MVVEYEQTLDDLVNFTVYHTRTSPLVRRSVMKRRIISSLVVSFIPFYVLFFATGNTHFSTLTLLFSLILGLCYFLLFPLIYGYAIRKRITKLYIESGNRGLSGKRRFIIQENGIQVESDTSDSTVKWAAVERIAINNEYVMLYINSVNALIIPKRAFANETEVRGFIEHIRSFIPNVPLIETK